MRSASLVLVSLVAGSAACGGTARPAEPTPIDLATLEAERVRHEGDPDELSAIGTAFYQAGAYERSRDVFRAVLALRPRAFHAEVQLGLSYEALGQYDAALDAYRRAGSLQSSKRERKAVEERVVALTRVILAAEARRVIAAESALVTTPPVPNTIAVLPWSYLGSNGELKPLERGLAHLVLSDLAKVSRFTLLERERVQALADELALDAQGRIEPATAARSGRLLRAAEVVQGSIRETTAGEIRLDANVVSATTSEVRATGTTSDQLEQLFAMEKALVLELLGRLGISLTPAEQRALAERPTADLQAFLSFSRGLEAEDRGRFGEAAQLFQQAALRDPSFNAARERSARSSRTAAAARMTPTRLARLAQTARPGGGAAIRGAQLVAAIQGIAPTLAGRFSQRPGKLAAIRARVAEALRQDDPARIGKILESIPRP
ncbi:MAG TPA: CsgG/HfaB family protein [Gemmatimonadales bacterium]|jgi:tetratricopeptide (TPR) repeat protein|nr:CsgG/HfaB family protein [Gemmatimonadales bacterium]